MKKDGKEKRKGKNTNRGTKKGDIRKILDKGIPLMLLGI